MSAGKHAARRQRRRRVERRPGSAPGTLQGDPQAQPPRIRAMAFGAEACQEVEIRSPDELRSLLERWPVTWVNVDGVAHAPTLEALGQLFGIHRLALEDVINTDQRAKVESFAEHVFLVARAPSATLAQHLEQHSLFVGRNWVLTFQEQEGDNFDLVRQRLRAAGSRIRCSGPGYLAYALLDAIVDSYFPVLDAVGTRLEALEDVVLEGPERETPHAIQAVKKELAALRRAVWPHRDALAALQRETGRFDAETLIHLRDCQDHVVRIVELLELYRETCSDLMNVHLSGLSNRMNEVMKVLTIIATIFIPLGFVAGVYGMNFDRSVSAWNMPELGWVWGYPFALGLMLAVALGLLWFFRRKGWLD